MAVLVGHPLAHPEGRGARLAGGQPLHDPQAAGAGGGAVAMLESRGARTPRGPARRALLRA
eukprot:2433378-Lingulodinium_polyedra.AAC.1